MTHRFQTFKEALNFLMNEFQMSNQPGIISLQ